MSFLIEAVLYIVSRVPELAARWHRRSGRMGILLQLVMGMTGACAVATALTGGHAVWTAFDDGALGWFPAIAIGLVAAFLLITGARAMFHAVRNPAPPALPDNVIPFLRPANVAPRNLHQYRRWDG
jgi:uncharacterized membrane protein YeaQ/YmgE (transglycosylase-associated protein family)